MSINNNLKIESDGTIRYENTATVFDDQVVDLARAKFKGSRITFNESENTVSFTSSNTLDDYIYVNVQMSHQWKSNTSIHPHIHFEQGQAAMPNFLLLYRWQINGGTKTMDWTELKCNHQVFTYSSGTRNQIASSDAIAPPSGYGISDIIQFRIIRDCSNASGEFTGSDPYIGTVSILSFDYHYEKDTDGSRTEYSK